MKQAFLKDDAFLDDVKKNWDEPGFRLWWLGQSGFLLQWNSKHVLLDPYLSDSLTHKYENSDKPHVRITEKVIDPDRLNFIDVVTSSHNHTDHLDAETLAPLMKQNPNLSILVPEANRGFAAERLQCEEDRFIGINDGSTVEIAGFEFTGVPAAHEEIIKDEQGHPHHLGYIIRFDSWCIYHSGDTILYDGMVERLKEWNIDVALLPINGTKPERRVPGNLNGKEAAQLAKDIGAKMVIPCHYDMFEFNTVTPDEFINEAQKLDQPFIILQNGEKYCIQAG